MLAVCTGVLAFALLAATDLAPKPIPLTVDSGERLVVVAPHPDDETLGAGGLTQRVLERGGSVLVVLVTAGDGYVEAVVHETGRPRPRPSQYVAYGKRRLRESRTALRVLGGGRVRLEFLGFPDGGLGGSSFTRYCTRTTSPNGSVFAGNPCGTRVFAEII